MSFRWKLLISNLVIITLLLGLFYFSTEQWMKNYYRATIREDLENQAEMLGSVLDFSNPDLDQEVDRITRTKSYRITVLDEQGRVLADSAFSGTTLDELDNHLNREEIAQAARSGKGSSVRYSTTLRDYFYYVAVRSPGGFLRLAIPMQRMEAVASDLTRALSARILLLFLVGSLLSAYLSWRITRKVDRLSEAAREIQAGRFVTSIPVDSSDELGKLARVLEEMSRKLQLQVQNLEEERNYLTTILNSMSEGVLVADERGRIIETNPAFRRIFSLPRDPVGKTPLEVVRDTQVRRGIWTVLEEQSQHEEEIHLGEKVLLARFAPIRGETKARGVVAVFSDISELRRLERIRKDFVSNVSHELKTPLTSIRGYAETLLDEASLAPVHRDFIHKIFRNASTLSEIVEELLQLSRLEGGERRLEKSQLSFQALMEEMEKEFAPEFSRKNVEFVYRNRAAADHFLAGESYIRRVFYNLLENALKYTEKGSVEVEMGCGDGELRFAVRDTGVGIPPEDLDRIFERFYRVHKDRSRSTGGTGIGLAIVKHIIQLHGGRVWAESQLGKGTTVFFTLPA